jgi:hypothetical protein
MELKTQPDGTCGSEVLRFACGGEVLVGSLQIGTWTSTGRGFAIEMAGGEIVCEPGGSVPFPPQGQPPPPSGTSSSTGGISSSSSGGILLDAGR